MTMTCVDQPVIRRGRRRAGFVSAFAEFLGSLRISARGKSGKVEDLNHHMLRDIGFFDGRASEASMRRAAERSGGMDQF